MQEKTRGKWYSYITNPATVITLLAFVFSLGVTWTNLNSRLSKVEEFQQTVNIVEIQKDLQEIKTNISWIMTTLQVKK